MKVTDEELSQALVRDRTPLDEALTIACLNYYRARWDPDQLDAQDQLSAQHVTRSYRALINLVHLSDVKARSEGMDAADPELAWVEVARQRFRRLRRIIPEVGALATERLFSTESRSIDPIEQQRQLYHEMRAITPAYGPEDWNAPRPEKTDN